MKKKKEKEKEETEGDWIRNRIYDGVIVELEAPWLPLQRGEEERERDRRDRTRIELTSIEGTIILNHSQARQTE